jgi:hypothetical protein
MPNMSSRGSMKPPRPLMPPACHRRKVAEAMSVIFYRTLSKPSRIQILDQKFPVFPQLENNHPRAGIFPLALPARFSL